MKVSESLINWAETEKVKRLAVFGAWCLIIMWDICVYGLVVLSALGDNLFTYAGFTGKSQITDFPRFYICGFMANHADLKHLVYDLPTQMRVITDLVHPKMEVGNFNVISTPYIIPLFQLFALLPLGPAFAVFTLTGVSLAFAGMYFVLCKLKNWKVSSFILFVLYLLGSVPAAHGLRIGQFSFFLLGFFFLYYFARKTNRPIWAGLALGLIGLKPHIAALFIIAELVQRRWRTAFTAIFLILALFAISIANLGWETVSSYPKVAYAISSTPEMRSIVCLKMIFNVTMPIDLALKVGAALFPIGALATILIWRKYGPTRFDDAFTATMLLMILFTPYMPSYDMLILALPAAIYLQQISLSPILSDLEQRPARAFLTLTLIAYPALTWFCGITTPETTGLLLMAVNVVLLVVCELNLKSGPVAET